MYFQLVLDRRECMPTGKDLDRAIRAEQQQPRGRRPSAEVGQPVERGDVAPVEILEPQHERLHRGQGLDSLGQLAQHSLPGHGGGLPLQGVQL